ncbi:hypothetical protein ACO1PK_01130 [Alishewanella sp. d11]|uniref:hypothetical protein n=1 Tax=Alishewanella sp. d11 TaxID=3414030 RepID=UPI003BF7814F
MTLSANMLIKHIEALLEICVSTLNSQDAVAIQQLQLQFKHVNANELLLNEIIRGLSEQVDDETVLSYFRMLLRHALLERKNNFNNLLAQPTQLLLEERV